MRSLKVVSSEYFITTQSSKSVSTSSTVIPQGQKRNSEVCRKAGIATQSSKSVSTSSTVITQGQKRNSEVCRNAGMITQCT